MIGPDVTQNLNNLFYSIDIYLQTSVSEVQIFNEKHRRKRSYEDLSFEMS